MGAQVEMWVCFLFWLQKFYFPAPLIFRVNLNPTCICKCTRALPSNSRGCAPWLTAGPRLFRNSKTLGDHGLPIKNWDQI
jgi:hypothetical protein